MAIKEIISLVLSVFVTGTLCSISFKYNDCNNSPNRILHVNRAELNPYPVVIPGDLKVAGEAVAFRPVSGSHYKLKISIHKHVAFVWVPIPCISQVGSCTYDDLCALLASSFGTGNATEGCPSQFTANNLPCHCSFTPGAYTLPTSTFKIPELSGLWSWLAAGDYHVDAKITDKDTGEEVACYHVEITFEQPPCHGFGCFFG